MIFKVQYQTRLKRSLLFPGISLQEVGMAILPIVFTPDPVLRRKARKITTFDKDLQTLIDNMVETLRDAPGVGLAAPQVGVSERLIVVEYPEKESDEDKEDAPKRLFVLINPEIVESSEETVEGVEACLSIPRMAGEVERHQKITIRGLNRHGKPVKLKVRGWLARIFQHEIDHLEGVLFTDRASRIWRAAENEVVVDDV
jgi:peptide deformylase